MRFLRRAFLLYLVLCGASFARAESAADRVDPGIDRGIALFGARLEQNPKDYLSGGFLAQQLLRKGRALGDMASYERAESLSRDLLKVKSDYAPLKAALAGALFAQHEFREAQDLGRELLKAAPNDTSSLALVADCNYELGDYDAAEKAYRELAEKVSDDPSIFARLARVAEVRGDTTKALELLRKALSLDEKLDDQPFERSWYRIRIGEVLFRTGKLDEAARSYEAAAKLARSYLVIDHLAEVAGARKDFAGALKLFKEEQEISHRPDLSQTIGDLLVFAGRGDEAKPYYDEARTAYEQSLERGKRYYYHHLASFYSDSVPDPKRALEYAREDAKGRGGVPVNDALAWAELKGGLYDDAVRDIERALAVGTKDPHVLFHASVIYGGAARFARSKELLALVSKVDPFYAAFHVHR